ncbi:breast carcinoma-amplified sequence 4 isoform X10 [Pteropus medius]|uniref:breast carcinoma-amplified sequence 4 isoform X10 n=1 Tax=Pteropus vampyrus TaxID=132908 RepID=UPI00196B829B|nr:breast carcinoma-amplified sequence 4 isoform X10 [Pteropus giganteus]
MCATGWRCPLGPALGQARAAAAGCAPAPPPPGGPQGMQPAGGGTPRPGSCDGLPRSLCQLDPAALLMLLVDADRPEPVRSGARELALFLTPEPGAEPLGGQGPAPFCFFAVPSGDARIGTLGEGRTRKKKVRTTVHAKEVEETIEGLLLRLEEFCSLTDMLRNQHGTLLLTEPHQLPAGVFVRRHRLRSHPASRAVCPAAGDTFPAFGSWKEYLSGAFQGHGGHCNCFPV